MNYTADTFKRTVQSDVRGQVGGRAKRTFDEVAFEIRDNQVRGCQAIVGHPAWFDDNPPVCTIATAGVAKSEDDQPAADQFQVRLEHLFTQRFQAH
jgi:hypothetical protein